MHWIYLSPHFDDVALSCGGLVWEQAHNGEPVSIWTVCAGALPPGNLSLFAQELHRRWETGENAPSRRKIEDVQSCHLLCANWRHFSIPDCIYRRDPQTNEYMYASEMALSGPLHPGDSQVVQALHVEIKRYLPPDAVCVCPVGLGNHVDHRLTQLAAEGLDFPFWYYADYPYVLRCKAQVEQMEIEGWINQVFPITIDGLAAWLDSISAHASQISTFWESDSARRQAVTEYMHSEGGVRLWKKPAG